MAPPDLLDCIATADMTASPRPEPEPESRPACLQLQPCPPTKKVLASLATSVRVATGTALQKAAFIEISPQAQVHQQRLDAAPTRRCCKCCILASPTLPNSPPYSTHQPAARVRAAC